MMSLYKFARRLLSLPGVLWLFYVSAAAHFGVALFRLLLFPPFAAVSFLMRGARFSVKPVPSLVLPDQFPEDEEID